MNRIRTHFTTTIVAVSIFFFYGRVEGIEGGGEGRKDSDNDAIVVDATASTTTTTTAANYKA